MRLNPITFVLGDVIARNRGVPNATAVTDGLIAAVVGPPVWGVVLASALAQNQASSAPAPAPVPTVTSLTPTTPGIRGAMTVNGTNFGTVATAITVAFSWPYGTPPLTTETRPLPSGTTVTPTQFAVSVPGDIGTSTPFGLTVIVNGVASALFTATTSGG